MSLIPLILVLAISSVSGFVHQRQKQLLLWTCSYHTNSHHSRYHDEWCHRQKTLSSYSSSTIRIQPTIRKQQTSHIILNGWLDNFLPKIDEYDEEKEIEKRKQQYPEQYPATYELLKNYPPLTSDENDDEKLWVRSLLKQTQLEKREIQLAFDANVHGWTPEEFHKAVDGKGAAIIIAETSKNDDDVDFVNNMNPQIVGGYNPKGWASLGGARPSVASFLFYSIPYLNDGTNNNSRSDDTNSPLRKGQHILCQKLRKVGGGGLACSNDDQTFGISLGPDSLVIGLQPGRERLAQSKLGSYFERRKDGFGSLFGVDGMCYLKSLKVYVGVYDEGEEIPYSGGVLDMTSG